MKLVSDEKIKKIASVTVTNERSVVDFEQLVGESAQAQLESCEKELREKVREIFGEIENNFCYPKLAQSGKFHPLPIEHWQALRQKYLEDEL